MSGITDSRLALGEALDAAGLRVRYDPGQVVTPGVLILPADPWVAPSGLATVSRSLRWRLVCVAGKTDAQATLEDLEDLVADTLIAVHGAALRGWGTPTFDAPGTVDLGGALYLAAIGRLDHLTEV